MSKLMGASFFVVTKLFPAFPFDILLWNVAGDCFNDNKIFTIIKELKRTLARSVLFVGWSMAIFCNRCSLDSLKSRSR